MTRLLVINPNTARAMTGLIGRTARAVAAAGTVVDAVGNAMGPESIESHYDEALAVPGVLAEIRRGGYDGYVIACFGDPGLDAAREIADGPVIGIAEAAMHTATLLGRSFSVVTTLSRTIGRARDLVHRYGFERACSGFHACDVPVLEVEAARKPLFEACARAAESDGCDVLVLGCAGMAGFCAEFSAELRVPVVDGVSAATKLAESLIALGLKTSDRGEFAPPPPKRYSGPLSTFGTQG
ncbi:aspartate/glutamate racemase family protein [Actinomadura fibrosa]|uniref:Aspartate/glutamate racemase family protein n=1 Tax=Actinomadura fibrosa TaxID=111802 RepID=A0ABW2XDS8_9ACTN|nr:aspartate/glutamate racemase family protein [Actinomadura fibrosa]